jgi:hypothetical protein
VGPGPGPNHQGREDSGALADHDSADRDRGALAGPPRPAADSDAAEARPRPAARRVTAHWHAGASGLAGPGPPRAEPGGDSEFGSGSDHPPSGLAGTQARPASGTEDMAHWQFGESVPHHVH